MIGNWHVYIVWANGTCLEEKHYREAEQICLEAVEWQWMGRLFRQLPSKGPGPHTVQDLPSIICRIQSSRLKKIASPLQRFPGFHFHHPAPGRSPLTKHPVIGDNYTCTLKLCDLPCLYCGFDPYISPSLGRILQKPPVMHPLR
jgi:hypothetical protein